MTLACVDDELGANLISQMKHSDIEFVVTLPDIVTSQSVLWPLSKDPDLKIIRVCKEDEGVSICAGLSFYDKRALLMIQNTGFLDSINSVRAIGIELEMPICMLIGLQGRQAGELPGDSGHYGVRIMEPILDVMGIETHFIATIQDAALMPDRIAKAYALSRPVAFLV